MCWDLHVWWLECVVGLKASPLCGPWVRIMEDASILAGALYSHAPSESQPGSQSLSGRSWGPAFKFKLLIMCSMISCAIGSTVSGSCWSAFESTCIIHGHGNNNAAVRAAGCEGISASSSSSATAPGD